MIYKIREFSKDSLSIFRKKDLSAIKKAALWAGYAKITLLSFLNGRVTTYHEVSFLSHSISFKSFAEFFHSVRELYILDMYFFRVYKKAPRIIDCGGNIGMSVLYFKYLYPDADITVFEPVPESFSFIKKNIHDNGLQDVDARNSAAFNIRGSVPVHIRQGWSHGASVTREQGGTTISVKAEVVSDFIRGEVDFLKMDIESSEQKVMEELHESGKLKLVKAMAIEFHYLYGSTENSMARVLTILEKEGFDYDVFFSKRKPNKPESSYIIRAARPRFIPV